MLLNTYPHLSCAVRLSEGLLCPLAPPTRGRKLRAVGVVAIGRASVGWGRPGAGTWLMGAVMQHKYPACSLDMFRHFRAANAQFKTTHAGQTMPHTRSHSTTCKQHTTCGHGACAASRSPAQTLYASVTCRRRTVASKATTTTATATTTATTTAHTTRSGANSSTRCTTRDGSSQPLRPLFATGVGVQDTTASNAAVMSLDR